MSNTTSRDKMGLAIRSFIKELDDYPGWREWKREILSYVLADDDRDFLFADREAPYSFKNQNKPKSLNQPGPLFSGQANNAWAQAGFRVVGNFVWTKSYASSTGYTQRRHECAALLAKGNPPRPSVALPDVLTGRYTGNRLHPTQKPVELMVKFIQAYSRPGEIVLDPFSGSGSAAVAAAQLNRHYIAIELMAAYAKAATERLAKPA